MSFSDLWSGVKSAVDSAESWIAGQSFWVQVPIVLGVLIPLLFLVAGLVDRLVEKILWPHTRREARLAATHPSLRRAAEVPVTGTPEEQVGRSA
ncbi:hypothetical protein GIS00_04310 [Nakamurella sp. YIM 132087]|uniref:Uncharacterized protein n=1 Tax=Nakamurella alba TaxID=2665158 RepID=A0A7K1FIA1_9ACTN|nr:hypothetical protein [Nakamurella alba]MTD13169.1 hypothetical protein [Nakamurella alba]